MTRGPSTTCPYCGMSNPEGDRFCGDCGAMLVSSEAMPRAHHHNVQRRPFRIRVNMLCYAGAILAVLALFLPWAAIQHEGTDDRINLGPYDFDSDEGYSSNFRYSVTLFLIGTIFVFLTPIGGILQLIGSVGFMLTASTTTFTGLDMVFWVGPVIGVLASFMVLVSLYAPMGVGYDWEEGEIDGISRILSISLYR